MTDLWNHWVNNWQDNYGVDTIRWKCTPGVGDLMYGMNIAHMRAFVNQKPTKLQLHWYHDKDYQYHYEDPESIIEKYEYIRPYYKWTDMVEVEHVFDSPDRALYKKFYEGVTRRRLSEMYRYWPFIEMDTTPINNKLVVWRPTNNLRQTIAGFKQPLLDWEWDRLFDRLTDFGYNIVEIDYRTPIREVFYHIRTAECCITYEGMWHYVAKNMFKPHIVFSESSITSWHTPAALQIHSFDIDTQLQKIYYTLEQAEERAHAYKKYVNQFINGW